MQSMCVCFRTAECQEECAAFENCESLLSFITKDCDMLLIQDCIEGTKFTVHPSSTILLFVNF